MNRRVLWLFFFSLSISNQSFALGAKTPVPPLQTRVLLTFDDGPFSRDYWSQRQSSCPEPEEWLGDLYKILDTLDAQRLGAQFYVSAWGDVDLNESCPTRNRTAMRRMFAQALREIRERGYEIRPHSYKHSSYFLFISEAEILDDLTRLEYEMRLTGVPYTRVWRPPYGSHSEAHRRAAEALGLVRDTWNIDSQDWTYHADAPFSEFFELFSRWRAVVLQRLRDEIRSGAGNGDVAEVLLHVNSRTAETLPEIVSAIANDYRETYGAESWGIDRPIFFVTRGR